MSEARVRRSSLRALAERAGLVAFGTLLALGAGELAARCMPADASFAGRTRAFADGALEPDRTLAWRPRAGASVAVAGVRYRFSSLGTRGLEPASATEHAPRVLALGDSVTMGWGVHEDAAWPARLEAHLAERGTRAHVVNGGVLGYGVDQYVARFDSLVPALRPSLVVVGYYPNDAEAIGQGAPGGASRSALWALVAPALGGLLAGSGVRTTATEHHRALHAPGTASWSRVERALAALAARCERTRTRCALALLPELYERPYPLDEVNARVRDTASAQGLAVFDVTALAGDPRARWVSPDDAHPDARTHDELAAAIASGTLDLLSP